MKKGPRRNVNHLSYLRYYSFGINSIVNYLIITIVDLS